MEGDRRNVWDTIPSALMFTITISLQDQFVKSYVLVDDQGGELPDILLVLNGK